jgi:hypothetical protein
LRRRGPYDDCMKPDRKRGGVKSGVRKPKERTVRALKDNPLTGALACILAPTRDLSGLTRRLA